MYTFISKMLKKKQPLSFDEDIWGTPKEKEMA